MQSLSFPKKLFVDPKTVSTTLYLFFRGWWRIFVLLKRTWPTARSDLLVGAGGSSVQLGYHQQHIYGRRGQMGQQYLFPCDVENPEERVLRRNLDLQVMLRTLSLAFNFLNKSDSHKMLKMRTVEEKKDTELISSRLVLQVQFWRRQKMLKECWMLLESQEQEGRSW